MSYPSFPMTNREECSRTNFQMCSWCSQDDCCDNQTPADAPESARRRPNMRDTAAHFLEWRGYSGLFNENAGCGCVIDDLMPCCCEGIEECVAAYRFECERCAKRDQCDEEGKGLVEGERSEWFVSTNPEYCRPDYREEAAK